MNARKWMAWMLMDEAPGGEGGGGGGEPKPDGGDGASGSPMGEGSGGEKPDDGAKPDGGDGASGSPMGEGSGGDKPEGGAKPDGEAKEPTPEEVEAYVGKIKAVDLTGGGDSGAAPAWDAEGVKAVAPLFIKHGIGDAAANEIIGAYAKHVSAQYQAAAEADRAVVASMRAECGKRFGADMKRFGAEGRRGGIHVFGAAKFDSLVAVEAFGSDPDIIEALAKIGRGLAPDTAPGGGSGGGRERPLAERMYGK